MEKFKVGDKVRRIKGRDCPESGMFVRGIYSVDGVDDSDLWISIAGNNTQTISKFPWKASYFELVNEEKTLDTLEVGDILVDSDADEKTVLVKINDCFLLSIFNCPNEAGNWYTLTSIKQSGWTLKQPEQPEEAVEEMTVDQVCKALGKTIKIVK